MCWDQQAAKERVAEKRAERVRVQREADQGAIQRLIDARMLTVYNWETGTLDTVTDWNMNGGAIQLNVARGGEV